MASIPVTDVFNVEFEEVKPDSKIIYTAENAKLEQLLSNDSYLKKELEGSRRVIATRVRDQSKPAYGIS